MDIPANLDTDLPFFAYGAFRPGELAFLRLKSYRPVTQEDSVRGRLLVRDGLPVLDLRQRSAYEIPGAVLTFVPNTRWNAYMTICELEPQSQYKWTQARTDNGLVANCLVAVAPDSGTEPLEGTWTGRDDPLFNEALDVVRETLDDSPAEWLSDYRALFRLEMAYLLLWSVLERYATLRYCLSGGWTQKLEPIASDPPFEEKLGEVLSWGLRDAHAVGFTVYSSDSPTQSFSLGLDDCSSSLHYYYQIRNNLAHRGKTVWIDYQRLLISTKELSCIISAVLERAFEDSEHLALRSEEP